MSDNVDRTIPQANVSLTYDGAALNFTWNEASGTLTATLPAADNGYHRITRHRCRRQRQPEPGLGGYRAPATERVSPFADLAGHWADPMPPSSMTTASPRVPAARSPWYEPDRNISRAEFFTLVARWMDLDLTPYTDVALPFADAATSLTGR